MTKCRHTATVPLFRVIDTMVFAVKWCVDCGAKWEEDQPHAWQLPRNLRPNSKRIPLERISKPKKRKKT